MDGMNLNADKDEDIEKVSTTKDQHIPETRESGVQENQFSRNTSYKRTQDEKQSHRLERPEIYILDFIESKTKTILFDDSTTLNIKGTVTAIPRLILTSKNTVNRGLSSFNSDISVPDRQVRWSIPDIKFPTPNVFRAHNISFVKDVLIATKNERIRAVIPPYGKIAGAKSASTSKTYFDEDFDKGEKALISTYHHVPPMNEREDVRLPWPEDISDKLFLTGSYSISGHPKVMIIPETNDRYEEYFAIICRDSYRVLNGGFAEIERVNGLNDLKQKYGGQRVEAKLLIVRDVKISGEDNRESEQDFLRKIVDNLAFQFQGFMILVTPDLNGISEIVGDTKNVIRYSKEELGHLKEREDWIIDIVSGFTGNASMVNVSSFGDRFSESTEEFDRGLENYKESDLLEKKLKGNPQSLTNITRNRDLLLARRREGEGKASDIHSGMKGFVYVYETVVNESSVEFESGEQQADVVADRLRFYEAETLFGRQDVGALLAEKTKKKGGSGELIFTMRNIDILRNFRELLRFLGRSNPSQKVTICGFDLNTEKLLPISEIIGYHK